MRTDQGFRARVVRARADLALSAVLVLVVLGPLLLDRGLVLVGDMVFVPHQPWKDAWTGGDGAVPRAVPSDAWVSLLSHLVPGALLQRLVLVSVVVGAALGVARLTWPLPFVARAAAAVLYVWNPYVHERLAIGHWALLCGYAVLPWVAWAVVRLRPHPTFRAPGASGAAAVLVTGFAVAAWTSPTGGALVTATALVLAWGRWRLVLQTFAVALLVNLPWIVPAFGNGADQLPPDAFGVRAFAASADTPFGTLGSLLTFGGIWKESVVPDARGDVLMAGLGAVAVLVAVAGLWVGRRHAVLPVVPALVLATGSLLLAWVGAVEVLRPVVDWVVLHVPGGGLLRDGQKWVAPWALVAATGTAQAVAALTRCSARRGVGQTWLVAVVLVPVMALPSFALGLGGFLHSDRFPVAWDVMKEEMEALDLADERVVVLPFSTYRRFDWTPRTVLDPAPRYFPGSMVTEDALTVPEGTVAGESATAARIRAAGTGEELARVLAEEGVGWALVHLSTEPGVLPADAQEVVVTDQLRLLRLATPAGAPGTEAVGTGGGWRAPAYAVLDLCVLLGTVGIVTRLTLRSRK